MEISIYASTAAEIIEILNKAKTAAKENYDAILRTHSPYITEYAKAYYKYDRLCREFSSAIEKSKD